MLAHGMAMSISKSYRDMIIADGAAYFWDLMNQPSATAPPAAGNVTLNVIGSPTAQNFTQDTKALLLNGSSQITGIDSSVVRNTNVTLELWIKTSTKSGGIFSANNTGNTSTPNTYDRHAYITSSGNICFGVWDTDQRYGTSTKACTDGNLHLVQLSISSNSTTLLIDGVADTTVNHVSTVADMKATFGYAYAGSWPNYVSPYLNGLIACPAIYNFAMTADMAMSHYVAGMQ